MQCTDITSLLGPFLDGELDETQRAAVAGHLETCPDCRKELDRLTAINDAVCDFSPDPGRKYWKQSRRDIAGRIDNTGITYGEERQPWYRALIPAPALGFAGVAVTAVLVFFVVKYTGQRDMASSGPDKMMRFEAPARETEAKTAAIDADKTVTTRAAAAFEDRTGTVAAEQEAPPPAVMQDEMLEEDNTALRGAGNTKTVKADRDNTQGIDGVAVTPPVTAEREKTATGALKMKAAAGEERLSDTGQLQRRTEGGRERVVTAPGAAFTGGIISNPSAEFRHARQAAADTHAPQEKLRIWATFLNTDPAESERLQALFEQATIYAYMASQDTSSIQAIEKAIAFLDKVRNEFPDNARQNNIDIYIKRLQPLLDGKK